MSVGSVAFSLGGVLWLVVALIALGGVALLAAAMAWRFAGSRRDLRPFGEHVRVLGRRMFPPAEDDPVRIERCAGAAIRRVLRRRQVRSGQVLVPERLVVGLHLREVAALGHDREAVELRLAAGVLEVAARGAAGVARARCQVEIVGDARAVRGAGRVVVLTSRDVGRTSTLGDRALNSPSDTVPVQALLVSLDGKTDVTVKGGPAGTTIGRSKAADALVPAPTVSAIHARIFPTGSGWAVADLESRNGTFVNGVRIVAVTRLEEGDEVRLGPTRWCFQMADPNRTQLA